MSIFSWLFDSAQHRHRKPPYWKPIASWTYYDWYIPKRLRRWIRNEVKKSIAKSKSEGYMGYHTYYFSGTYWDYRLCILEPGGGEDGRATLYKKRRGK